MTHVCTFMYLCYLLMFLKPRSRQLQCTSMPWHCCRNQLGQVVTGRVCVFPRAAGTGCLTHAPFLLRQASPCAPRPLPPTLRCPLPWPHPPTPMPLAVPQTSQPAVFPGDTGQHMPCSALYTTVSQHWPDNHCIPETLIKQQAHPQKALMMRVNPTRLTVLSSCAAQFPYSNAMCTQGCVN